MLPAELLGFVRAALPAPPLAVLEVGAGAGELAGALRELGYAVTAIDPAAEPDTGVDPVALRDVQGSFDAAVAIVSLHHVEPLAESCARLAEVLGPGARLVIDELDAAAFDERAASWWLAQRGALGAEHDHDEGPAEMVAGLREHVAPWSEVTAALAPAFAFGEPVRGPYLYRWKLGLELRDAEEAAIAAGSLPATGARVIAVRRD